ncbi:MAG: hypothetical protein P8175_07990, partial [Deltaproteobacteria bacterium]
CSTTKDLYQTVMPGDTYTELKKRVLLLPFIDQADLGAQKVEDFTSRLVTLLDQKRYVLVVRPSGPVPTSTKIRSPGFGILIDPDQAKWAEDMGMNVLLTVVIPPFEVYNEKKGIWPFRKFRRRLEMSMVVNALDVTNGTLLLTHLESRRMRLPDFDEKKKDVFDLSFDEKQIRTRFTQSYKPSEIDRDKQDKAWSEIIKAQASAIADALKEVPWSGRILSVDSRNILINAGQDVGLKKGTLFDVFSQGEAIVSATGGTFNLLGQKAGEIKVVEAMNERASAVPSEGGPFLPGQIIQSKN